MLLEDGCLFPPATATTFYLKVDALYEGVNGWKIYCVR